MSLVLEVLALSGYVTWFTCKDELVSALSENKACSEVEIILQTDIKNLLTTPFLSVQTLNLFFFLPSFGSDVQF